MTTAIMKEVGGYSNNENYMKMTKGSEHVSAPVHIIANKVFNEARRHWSWKGKEPKRRNENKRCVVRKTGNSILLIICTLCAYDVSIHIPW